MKKFIEEFKSFAMKGNMIDLAVGVVIGSAFTAIVNSIVDDLIMPILSILTGSLDFSNLFLALNGEKYATLSAVPDGVAVFAYGKFITAVINFLIIALVLFVIIKQLNKLKKEEPAPEPTERECPYCMSKISKKATKCAFCGSLVEAEITE